MPPATIESVFASINEAYHYQPEAPGRDEWRTPAEFRAAGGGDCEDFAIAYWYALRHTAGRARLAWCWRNGRQAHMVCLHFAPGENDPLVLDVAVDAVCRLSERPDLTIQFELDADGFYWKGKKYPVEMSKQWANLQSRIK